MTYNLTDSNASLKIDNGTTIYYIPKPFAVYHTSDKITIKHQETTWDMPYSEIASPDSQDIEELIGVLEAAGSSEVVLIKQEYGKAERTIREWLPTTSVPIQLPPSHIVFPARSRVIWRVKSVSDNETGFSCVWLYDLIDE